MPASERSLHPASTLAPWYPVSSVTREVPPALRTKKRTKNDLVDMACTAIGELEAQDFSTEAMLLVKEWLEAEGAGNDFPSILVHEYCTDAMEPDGDAMDFAMQIRRFAAFLVILAGREGAERAVMRAGDTGVEDQAALVLLGRAFNIIEEPPPDPELLGQAEIGIPAMVKALSDLPAATGDLLAMLSSMPGISMEFLTGEILKAAAAHPKREHFAVGVMLTPCGDEARCGAAQPRG